MKDFSNQTVYIRETHGENYTYTVIANSLINDERLNVTEIGLMTKFLSKGKNYIFNSTYEQKASGIGKIYYNACLQKLKNFGYIVKKNLKTGGIKWIIIESKEIITDLQTIGYLQWNYTKKYWMIDESKFAAFQLSDFHHIAENENMENENMENENMENENMENENMEINPLLSTNTLSTNEPIKDEIKKEEINKNEPLIREKILESISLPKIEEVKPVIESLHTPIKNDFDLVYNTIQHFKSIVSQNPNWTNESIKNHSNAFIAMNAFNYANANEQEKAELLRKDKTLTLQHFLTKYACRIPDSELRKHYQHECTVNDKQDLMY